MISLAAVCKWISADEWLLPSQRGELLAALPHHLAAREMLKDYILLVSPAWSALLTKGRHESVPFFAEDVKVCFYDAELMVEPASDHVIEWWDAVSTSMYSNRDAELLRTGRQAERLSLAYEALRTRSTPKWSAIESNLRGYDLVSVKEEGSSEQLLIEVKGSISDQASAYAHITRKEWNTAVLSKNYVFHFWLLGNPPRLSVLTTECLSSHMPEDRGSGKWQEALVPFKQFVFLEA